MVFRATVWQHESRGRRRACPAAVIRTASLRWVPTWYPPGVRRIPNELLDQLDIESAVKDEANTCRNQVPSEPWIRAILKERHKVASWLRDRLSAGLVATPNVDVNVRKSSLGTRPVPIMGIAERVTYRALATYIVGRDLLPDRSTQAYRQFSFGPISYGFPSSAAWSERQPLLRYVVEADIAAFYQYIDHDVLRHELQLQTGKIEYVDLLIELLAEMQQRSFGIPQLVDASDWLSEIYIRIVERTLVRRGWPVWRFNDDFRIGCHNYTEALNAIERLDESARAVGLTVSDYKTFTPTFSTYVSRVVGLSIDDNERPIDATDVPTDADVIVSDYEEMDEDPVEMATAVLRRTQTEYEGEDKIDLKRPKGAQVRDLQRAIKSLASQQDPSALEYIFMLLVYLPSLTPRICDYITAVTTNAPDKQCKDLINDVVNTVSLGEWQALWLVHVCRQLKLVGEKDFRDWVSAQRDRGRGRPLGAEAALALAEAAVADFDDLDQALRSEPEALAPWFLLGMKSMANSDPTKYGDRARAVRDSSPFNKILLDI